MASPRPPRIQRAGGGIPRCKRWDFCDVSLEGEKPYHERCGGYGWIGQFHTKLFCKMLFVIFLCQRKGCFLHRLIWGFLVWHCWHLFVFFRWRVWNHGAGESSGGGICGKIWSKKFVKGVQAGDVMRASQIIATSQDLTPKGACMVEYVCIGIFSHWACSLGKRRLYKLGISSSPQNGSQPWTRSLFFLEEQKTNKHGWYKNGTQNGSFLKVPKTLSYCSVLPKRFGTQTPG